MTHPLVMIDLRVRGGRPCIRGTQIAVADILGWLADGSTPQAIVDRNPGLTPDHVRAALALSSRVMDAYRDYGPQNP